MGSHEMMPADTRGSGLMLPECESGSMYRSRRLIIPERGMDSYADGEKVEKERLRSMLKNLKLEEEEKMKAKEESIFSVADTRLELEPAGYRWKNMLTGVELEPAGSCWKKKKKNNKKKKVMVRVGKEHIEYMKTHPLPPPYQPIDTGYWYPSDAQAMLVAQQKAEREERERVLAHYDRYGFAEMEFEVTDDEAAEEFDFLKEFDPLGHGFTDIEMATDEDEEFDYFQEYEALQLHIRGGMQPGPPAAEPSSS